jgi:hypothetical protein
MGCLIIKSPVTGEQIESNFYQALETKYGEKDAHNIFNTTLSQKYTTKFGNWMLKSSMLNIDKHGEPLVDKAFIKTLSTTSAQRRDLEHKVKGFIARMGFKYEEVNSLLGNKISNVSGVTDFLLQTVKVVEGANPSTLVEEAAHVYVEMLYQKNMPLYNSFSQLATKPVSYTHLTLPTM